MSLETRIRGVEGDLWQTSGVHPEESFLKLERTRLRVRALSCGHGPSVVLLHGVSLAAAAWAPLLGSLPGYRLHAIDLPGHGLSDPVAYRRGEVRRHSQELLDDIFDALELERAAVIAHSLSAMFALWHAATNHERIASLALIGDPAVALPGVTVRMPLSLMTVPGVGRLLLSSPAPRPVHRRLFALGVGGQDAAAAPASLVAVMRLAGRRPSNAKTVASLMHALNGFRRPRPESVLTPQELANITQTTLLVWGTDDPYMSPALARPSVQLMPAATLIEVAGGHAPWFAQPGHTATLVGAHLAGTGFPAVS